MSLINNNHQSYANGILSGVAITVAVLLLGAWVISFLVIKEILNESAIKYAVIGVMLFSVFGSQLLSYKISGANKVSYMLLYVLALEILLSLVNILICGGRFDGFLQIGICILLGGILAWLCFWCPASNRKRRRNR